MSTYSAYKVNEGRKGVRDMPMDLPQYYIGIQVQDEVIKDIFERMENAEKEIMFCLNELKHFGIVTVIKSENAESGN